MQLAEYNIDTTTRTHIYKRSCSWILLKRLQDSGVVMEPPNTRWKMMPRIL